MSEPGSQAPSQLLVACSELLQRLYNKQLISDGLGPEGSKEFAQKLMIWFAEEMTLLCLTGPFDHEDHNELLQADNEHTTAVVSPQILSVAGGYLVIPVAS